MTIATFVIVVPDEHKNTADALFAGIMQAQPVALSSDAWVRTAWQYSHLKLRAGTHYDLLSAFNDETLTNDDHPGVEELRLSSDYVLDTSMSEEGEPPFTPTLDYLSEQLEGLGYTMWQDPTMRNEQILAEANRRVHAGRTFTIGAKTVALTGEVEKQAKLIGQLLRAQSLHGAGVTDEVIQITGSDLVRHMLTPQEAIGLIGAAMAWVEEQERIAMDMIEGVGDFTTGVPANWSDDQFWN